jgi:hypothetical protein
MLVKARGGGVAGQARQQLEFMRPSKMHVFLVPTDGLLCVIEGREFCANLRRSIYQRVEAK